MLSSSRALVRSSVCRSSFIGELRSVHTAVNQVQDDASVGVEARSYTEIPGPTNYQLVRSFLLGGKYYKKDFADYLGGMNEQYGNILKIPGMFGKRDVVLITDPEDFRKVFQVQGQFPIRRGLDTIVEYRTKTRKDFYQGVIGVAVDQGASWWDFRQKVNPAMMKPQTAKKYVPAIDEVAQDFVKRIQGKLDVNQETPDDFYSELNMWALESIATITMDTRLGIFENSNMEKMHTIMRDLKVFFELTVKLDFQPSLWKYFPTPGYRKLMKSSDNILYAVEELVNLGMQRLKERPDRDENESVLKKLLDVDPKVAVIMVMDSLFAGVDTTASLTFAVLYCLAKNPEKQEALRQEILTILPEKSSKLTVENMANMPYLRACIKETLRVQPVTFGNFRTTNEDVVLKGYHIPKGTDILMAGQLIQKDETYFQNAKSFVPERWIRAPNSKITCPVNASSHPFAYIPFGFGTRMCIGRRFAEMEVESLVCRLVRNYKIEWHHPDPKIVSLAINMPVSPLKFRLTEISK
ncbi:Cytochrome P450 [Sergentomyia squamirostris]